MVSVYDLHDGLLHYLALGIDGNEKADALAGGCSRTSGGIGNRSSRAG